MSLQLQTAQNVKAFLWEKYDPHDDLIYPKIDDWTELLEKAIASNNYDKLTKNESLNILFGLIHKNRIVDGLWDRMFSDGVTQRLLKRL